jgi:aminopeptidase
MYDPRIEKLADVLVHYSVDVQPGELVWLRFAQGARDTALLVYKKVLEAGAHPIVTAQPGSDFDAAFFRLASDEQLDFMNPVSEWLISNADVRISLGAPDHTKALASLDSKKLARSRKANERLTEIFMERQSAGDLRWTGTLLPTHALAQEANMSFEEYSDFVFKAGMLHRDDPVAYWKNKSVEQQRLVDWLDGKEKITCKGDNIDLTLSIAGRTFINADGKKNFPDGEIFTGPVEDSVNGWVRFSFPAIYGGQEVRGVELTFEDGRVTDASAEKGEDFLLSVLDTDEGARTLGEFAIGTNENVQQFTGSILFDEKIGGTVHMAVGAGYPDTGSINKSAVHWDMICDMRQDAEISVDGELFYKDGEFQV